MVAQAGCRKRAADLRRHGIRRKTARHVGVRFETAALEGFNSVLTEMDPEYVKDIQNRLNVASVDALFDVDVPLLASC